VAVPQLVVISRADGTGVTFDCSLNETHTRRSTVTRFPVEVGGSIVDNIRAEPDGLTLEAIVGAAPLSPDRGQPLADDRAQRAYEELLRMQEAGDVVTVRTSLRSYSSMAIESTTVPRNAETGLIVKPSISLVQIRTVSSSTISLPVAVLPRNNPTREDGRRNGEEVATPAPSLLRQAARGIARLAGGDAGFAALEQNAR